MCCNNSKKCCAYRSGNACAPPVCTSEAVPPHPVDSQQSICTHRQEMQIHISRHHSCRWRKLRHALNKNGASKQTATTIESINLSGFELFQAYVAWTFVAHCTSLRGIHANFLADCGSACPLFQYSEQCCRNSFAMPSSASLRTEGWADTTNSKTGCSDEMKQI